MVCLDFRRVAPVTVISGPSQLPLHSRPKTLTVALWKLMRAILSRRRITRLVRPPTDAVTLRALSIEALWLCVAAESQSSRGLLEQRSSIELGHRRVASSGAGTTTVTERSL